VAEATSHKNEGQKPHPPKARVGHPAPGVCEGNEVGGSIEERFIAKTAMAQSTSTARADAFAGSEREREGVGMLRSG
jgi:hypothetical protein